MSEQNVIDYILTINAEPSYAELRKLEIAGIRVMNMLSQMGLPPEIRRGIQMIQQMIMIMRQLQITIRLLQTATGSIGWLYALTSLGATGMHMGSVMTMGFRSTQA